MCTCFVIAVSKEGRGEDEKDYSHLRYYHNDLNVLQSSLTETVSLALISLRNTLASVLLPTTHKHNKTQELELEFLCSLK